MCWMKIVLNKYHDIFKWKKQKKNTQKCAWIKQRKAYILFDVKKCKRLR